MCVLDEYMYCTTSMYMFLSTREVLGNGRSLHTTGGHMEEYIYTDARHRASLFIRNVCA